MPKFFRGNASLRLIVGFVCVMLSMPARAGPLTVFVEPSQTVLRTLTTVEAGGRATYALPLAHGETLYYEIYVSGGLMNTVAIGLLDATNHRNLGAGEPYHYVSGTEQTVWSTGKYVFRVPLAGTYHLLIDNTAAWFAGRDVVVYAYVLRPTPTVWSLQFQQSTQKL